MMLETKYVVELVGGYCGRLGNVNARKTVYLPFVPFSGLLIIEGGYESLLSDDQIEWDCDRQVFEACVVEFGDVHNFGTLKAAVDRLVAEGWEIGDVEDFSK